MYNLSDILLHIYEVNKKSLSQHIREKGYIRFFIGLLRNTDSHFSSGLFDRRSIIIIRLFSSDIVMSYWLDAIAKVIIISRKQNKKTVFIEIGWFFAIDSR